MKKKTLEKINKFLHLIVVISMVLQPVSAPGIMVAVAEDSDLAAATEEASAPEAPAEEPAQEEPKEETPAEEPAVEPEKEAPVEELAVEPATEPEPASEVAEMSDPAPEVPASEEVATEPVVEEIVPTEGVETNPDETNDGTTPLAEDTTIPAEEGGQLVGETATTEETSSDGDKEESSDEAAVEEETIEEVVVETPIVETVERGVWMENLNDGSMSIAVEEGVEYEYKDSGLKIIFTALPENLGTITVKEITLSEDQRRELGALTTEAWDITSDMADGSFEYDLTLPLQMSVNPEKIGVAYVEEEGDLDDADKAEEVNREDVELNNAEGELKAKNLDHFTVFVISTYESDLLTDKEQYEQDETVYIKAGGLFVSRYYRIDIIEPNNTSHNVFSCDDSNTQLEVSFDLPSDAEISSLWKVEITKYDAKGDCQSGNDVLDQAENNFEVIAAENIVSVASATATVDNGCMQEVSGNDNLNCTANDVSIANVSNIVIESGDGCDFPGDTVTFTATWDVQSTSTERYDIGLYFSTDGDPDGDGALSGSCSVSSLANEPTPPWYNFDGDACGDISSAAMVHPSITMTVQCLDDDEDNTLDLPYCTSWDQNAGGICSSPTDAYPGAPSKCNCNDGFEVPITVPFSAEIEVVKDLVPSEDPGRFNLQIDGTDEETNVGDGGTTGKVEVSAGTNNDPGDTHSVGEAAYGATDLGDYTTSISCVDRGLTTFDGGPALTISGAGPLDVDVDQDDDIVCTITNTVQQSTLTLVKNLPNDNGGTVTQDDFNVYIDDQPAQWGDNIVSPGQHVVSEDTLAGYTPSVWNDDCDVNGNVTVAPGESATCDITNDDQQAYITVVKIVTNNNGGNAQPDDFNLTLEGGPVSSGVAVPVNPGTYTAGETLLDGYIFTNFSGDCDSNGDVTVALGESKTCTLTNDDTVSKLTLVKDPTNDNGGNALPNDFLLTIGGNPATSGVAYDLAANTPYAINETLVDGYEFVSITGDDKCPDALGGTVTLDEGDDITCTITNNDVAPTVTLIKNVIGGIAGVNDFGLAVGGIGVDSGVATDVDANIPIALNEAGLAGYTFTSLTGDEGCPNVLEGTVTLDEGEDITCTIANTRDTGNIQITKLIDADGDLSTTDDQTAGANWQFDVDGTGSDTTDPVAGYTDVNGVILFENLKTGEYTVIETTQDGYDLIGASCGEANGTFDQIDSVDDVIVSKDVTTICTFYNSPNGNIHGFKWDDLDGSGDQNGEEEKLSGWRVFIDENDNKQWDEGEQNMFTSDDPDLQHFGWYWFENLFPGEYSICEEVQTGWNQTYPGAVEDVQCHTVNLPHGESTCINDDQLNFVVSEQTCNFGNQFVTPQLKIDKFVGSVENTFLGGQSPGDTVTYILKIKAAGGDEGEIENMSNVNDVLVTDLPPAGFTYVPGSANLSSSVGGAHIGALALSHVYASPGEWSLGTMVPGEVITLTYDATISGSQDEGTYGDLAWAVGKDLLDNQVIATQGDPEIFAGTAVEVLIPEGNNITLASSTETKTKTRTKTKRVLGAALPATGASPIGPMAALILLIIGFNLVMEAKKRGQRNIKPLKETFMKIFVFAILSGAMLIFGGQAMAADSNLAVKIETPDAVSYTKNFQIGFVALDIIGENNIAVKCYAGPEGGPFAEFDTYSLAPGGTSGNCDVSKSPIVSDGSYEFYVTADAGADTNETGHVKVFIDLTPPGTPLNYDRDDDNCTATFTTANDGQTVKVELYRSTELSFIASEANRVSTVAILPNTDGSITDPGPNCGDYFYAIRAVDVNGNGSGFVGDEDVDVDTRTRTRTRTITVNPGVTGAIATAGGGVAGGETGAEGEVAGAETGTGEEGASAEGGAGEEGQVLGEETERTGSFFGKYWPWGLGLIILAAIYYYVIRRKRKGGNSNISVE